MSASWILVNVLVILLIIAGFVIWNLLTKNETLEDTVIEQQKVNNYVEFVLDATEKRLSSMQGDGVYSAEEYLLTIQDIQSKLNLLK
jgi:hypothetical protein